MEGEAEDVVEGSDDERSENSWGGLNKHERSVKREGICLRMKELAFFSCVRLDVEQEVGAGVGCLSCCLPPQVRRLEPHYKMVTHNGGNTMAGLN